VLSTTCFGLYIGHHHVYIKLKLIKRLYDLYGMLWGAGTRSRFTIVGSLNVGIWDRILTSVVVWSWSTLEHDVWTGIRQVISSVHLLIVSMVLCWYL